jgi:hypothetical protein
MPQLSVSGPPVGAIGGGTNSQQSLGPRSGDKTGTTSTLAAESAIGIGIAVTGLAVAVVLLLTSPRRVESALTPRMALKLAPPKALAVASWRF